MASWNDLIIRRNRRKVIGVFNGGNDDAGKTLAETIAQGWQHLDTTVINEPHPHQFRPSLLPYCPVIAVLEPDVLPLKWSEDFFFNSGTSTHSFYQKWLPLVDNWGDHVWGDWFCNSCRNITEKSYKTKCGQCGSKDLEYRELGLSLQAGEISLTGHIDLIYWVPGNKPIIVDIKTARESRMAGDGLPFSKHLHQVYAYCFLFEHNIKISPEGVVFAYTPRELFSNKYTDDYADPTGYFWGSVYTDTIRSLTQDRLAKAFRGRAAELNIRANGFSQEQANNILKYRPCTSQRIYKDWMACHMGRKCQFWYNDHCGANISDLKMK